jgi:hypothetical protein
MPKKTEEVGDGETPEQKDEKAEVKAWLRTISKTEKFRDKEGEKQGWKRFISEFKGDWQFLQDKVKIPLVPINLVYAYVKTEIARLYFRDPWITINPKRKEDIGAAQIAEQVINYVWGELKLKSEIKKVLTEELVIGHGWIKVGYVAEFGTVESQPKEPEKRSPGRPRKGEETRVDTNEYLKSENVFAYYVKYDDIIFDPSATYPAPHNARWMAQKIVKPLRAVQESGIYEHTDDLRSSSVLGDDETDASLDGNMEMNKDIKSVILWEIYDLDHMKVTTVSPGCEYKLREIDYPDYLNAELPFVQFAFNFIPGEVYPLSDIAPHEPQIIELIKMQAIELNHLKRWNRQIIVAPDFFTKEEEDKFRDGADGAIIKGNVTAGQSLDANFYIPPYAPVQQDVYGVWNQVMDVWRNVAGQSNLERGATEKAPTRTLGELRLQLQGGRARADEKIDLLEDAIETVARKLLVIMQKKFDLPKIARIVGEKTIQEKLAGVLPQRPSAQPQIGGQPNPVADKSMTTAFSFTWNKTDIMGDMDVDVVAGSTVPMDKEAQIEIMEKMIPLLPGIGAGPGTPAAQAFGKEMVRLIGMKSLEEVIEIAKNTPPQPDPEMAKAQMEMQAKQQDMQNQQALATVKIQGQQAQQQIKLQGMQEKLELDRQKNQMNMEKEIISTILHQARGIRLSQRKTVTEARTATVDSSEKDKPCETCGNENPWARHSKKERVTGKYYEECNRCFDSSIPSNPDVYFRQPYWDENLWDRDDPSFDPQRGTFIRSKAHKAYVLKKCGLREDGDRNAGGRAFDPLYSRHAHAALRR